MSLATQFLESERFTLPEFPVSELFSSFSLEDFSNVNFSNFLSFKMTPRHTFYAGGPTKTKEETEEFVNYYFESVMYVDRNDNDLRDSNEKSVSDFKIFISDDGAFLLEKYNLLQKSIGASEIAVFIELNKGDVFSDSVMLVSVGYKAKKHVNSLLTQFDLATGDKFSLSQPQIDKLISSFTQSTDWISILSNVIIESTNNIIDGITTAGAAVFGEIADFFGETLRFTDGFWNPRVDGYTIGVVNDLIYKSLNNTSKKIDSFIDSYGGLMPFLLKKVLNSFSFFIKGIAETLNTIRGVQEFVIAFICGIWNGLMDLISGIFGLIQLVFSALKSGNKAAYSGYVFATNGEFYEALMLEYLDNLFKEFIKIDWKEVIIQMNTSRKELEKYISDIPSKMFNKITDLNHAEVGYYIGYVVFQIVEFIFPPLKFAKLGKLGKLSKIANIFGDIGSTGSKISRLGGKARSVADDFFDFIVGLIEKLKGGTANFKVWIKEIFINIRKWLDDLFGFGVKVDSRIINDFIKKYPKLIKRGNVKARSKFDKALIKIDKQLKHKKFKTARHRTFKLNKLKGDEAEEIIRKVLKGERPSDPKSFKTSLSRRYPDNFFKGLLREVKAGDLTIRYKKQILKDIEILARGNLSVSGELIKKIEWHVFGTVDKVVLDFIELELKGHKGLSGKFVIIIH